MSAEGSGKGEEEEEFVVDDVRDGIECSRGSRFDLLEKELGIEPVRRKFSRETVINGIRGLSKGLLIFPDNRCTFFCLSH